MRCKIGDLCVVVNSIYPENIGKLIVIVKSSELPHRDWIVEYCSDFTARWFNCKSTVYLRKGETTNKSDSDLRPIRDQEGDDEMIRIAGLPIKIKEAA